MPLIKDGIEVDRRAKQALKDALNAQLILLNGFFPLPGWAIVRRHRNTYKTLAVHGAWHRKNPNTIDALMNGKWAAFAEHPGFHYRRLNDAEQRDIDALLGDASTLDLIIRYPLRNAEGYVQAWLLGVAKQNALTQILQSDWSAEYVKHAVVAMSLSISLYTSFESTQQNLLELQQNAFTEPLTGVLNRAGWVNRVQHLEAIVARSEEDVAIVMLDLDLLKLVNDMQGHSAGDELLQLTAQTIQSVLRTSDVVGRLGGDEFGVAVRGVGTDMAFNLIERLRTALNAVGVEVSIGMAMKSEAGSLNETLTLADQRMYEEKRSKPLPDRAMNWQRNAVDGGLDSPSEY